MNMHERIMSGKLFTDMCEGMPDERLRAKTLQKKFNDLLPEATAERAQLIEEIFDGAKGAWIEPPIYFCYGKHTKIGAGTYINVNCNFIDDGQITIGKNVMFGPAVTIATVGHPLKPDMRGYMYTDPVEIGDDCWIGAGAVICPGAKIGNGTTIGAGSVVIGEIPDHCVAAGNPCKVIRPLDERDEIYYYKDRKYDEADLAEEKALRANGLPPKTKS